MAPGRARATSLSALAQAQHERRRSSAGRARHDLRPHGRPARDRRAGDDGVTPTRGRSADPRAQARVAAGIARASTPTLYPQLADRTRGVRLRRSARPTRRTRASSPARRTSAGLRLLSARSGARTRSDRVARAGARLRGRRQPRASPGSRLGSTRASRGSRRPRDRRPRPVRASDRHRRASTPAQQGDDVSLDARPHRSRRTPRQVLRSTVARVAREGRHGDRARPARPAACSRWRTAPRLRREPVPDGRRATVQRNRAVTDAYEPGSTFKLVTVARRALGAARHAATTFTLPYSIQVADRVDPRRRAARHRDDDASRRSSRTRRTSARSRSPKLLGATRLDAVDRRSFGFGHADGHRLPRREPGIVLPLDEWSGSTIGNVPIGQGIAVTPIQMASAYAAIANGGVWLQPHLVDHVQGEQAGGRRRAAHPVAARVDRAAAARCCRTSSPTRARAARPRCRGYTVAGKTGTAQKPDPHGGYSTTQVRRVVRRHGAGEQPAARRARDRRRAARARSSAASSRRRRSRRSPRFDLQYLEVADADRSTSD